MFSTMFVIVRTIVLQLKVTNFNGHWSLVVSPTVKCCLCLLWYNFCIERFLWIGFKSKGSTKQLYRAIFINCQDMVSCWKSVAVKKLKKDLAVSKVP